MHRTCAGSRALSGLFIHRERPVCVYVACLRDMLCRSCLVLNSTQTHSTTRTGFYQPVGTTACHAECASGYFQQTLASGETACAACPPLSTSPTRPANSKGNPTSCLCQQGYFSASEAECYACGINAFSSVGSVNCSCNVGFLSAVPGIVFVVAVDFVVLVVVNTHTQQVCVNRSITQTQTHTKTQTHTHTGPVLSSGMCLIHELSLPPSLSLSRSLALTLDTHITHTHSLCLALALS